MENKNTTNTKIFITSIDKISENKLLVENIPNSERFQKVNDRKRFLLGRVMLNYVLNNFNYALDIGNLEYSKYKKPFIKGFLNFNISHSGNFVVLGTSLNKIGVDIEKKDPSNVIIDGSFFSLEEKNLLSKTSDLNTDFFKIWTAKEAIVKANGIGLNSRLHKINTMEEFSIFEDEKYYTKEIFVHEDYCCHVALNHPIEELEIINLEF